MQRKSKEGLKYYINFEGETELIPVDVPLKPINLTISSKNREIGLRVDTKKFPLVNTDGMFEIIEMDISQAATEGLKQIAQQIGLPGLDLGGLARVIEEAAETIENCYGRETELSDRLRDYNQELQTAALCIKYRQCLSGGR